MLKPLLICFVLWASALLVSGQKSTVNTASELLSRIQKSKPDTNRIALFMELGNYYLDRTDEHRNAFDTALLFFNQGMELSNQLNAVEWQNRNLASIGNCYMGKDDLERGKACFKQVIDYYKKIGNKEQEVLTWFRLGQCIPGANKENIPDKIQSFEIARVLFGQTHNRVKEIESYQDIAAAHLGLGKADLAETELLQVLDQYRAVGYKRLHETYDLLADVSKYKADLHKELLYRMELIKSMEATADTARADYYHARLALVYADLGMYDQSIAHITRSMQIIKNKGRFGDFYGDLSLVIYDFISEGKPSEALDFLKRTVKEVPPADLAQKVDLNEAFGSCYTALKEYDKAEEYYLAMMRDYKITNFNKNFYSGDEQMVTDYIHYNEIMGTFYDITRRYQKAGYYLDRILLLPEGSVRPVTLSKIHQMQFRVDSASGNYLAAIRHFEIQKKIEDSLFNAGKSKQIAELQIKYETSQKEQSIKLLEIESKRQHAELQKVNMQRNITFAGVAMLLLIAGLAYNGYRHKQRSNQELQIKQKEINRQNVSLQHLLQEKDVLLNEKDWLLKEVHHRVKNNLQIVISLLNAQTSFLDNPSALEAIKESRERMQAIALIHQKLYQPNNSTLINMNSYIMEMVSYLESSFADAGRLCFKMDVDKVEMDVSQAVPLGLILNEAITNAVKYAFPENRQGTIFILLHRNDMDDILLKIMDDGQGLPANFDLAGNNSLGIQLMKLFAEQLEGDLRFRNKNGLEISLSFKLYSNISTPSSFLYAS